MVCVDGFEPPATRFQTEDSDLTELYTDWVAAYRRIELLYSVRQTDVIDHYTNKPFMVASTGFEPVTYRLSSECSTPEL